MRECESNCIYPWIVLPISFPGDNIGLGFGPCVMGLHYSPYA